MKRSLYLTTRRWRVALWAGALIALATPWVLMRLTGQGHWTEFDFVVFGVMLSAVGVGIELAMRLSSQWTYRVAVILSVIGGFLMVWANLAVGIIGSEENPQNLICYSVLIAGLTGAFITKFNARGLMWTLRAMAAMQFAVFLAAALLEWALLPVVTIVYMLLWLAAGELFKRASCAP